MEARDEGPSGWKKGIAHAWLVYIGGGEFYVSWYSGIDGSIVDREGEGVVVMSRKGISGRDRR